MDSVKQPVLPNSAPVAGGVIQNQYNYAYLAMDDSLKGRKKIVPISVEIGSFVKETFSKIK